MGKVLEISKVEYENGFWVVKILSAATGRWIIQGEHHTEAEAEEDLKNWR